MSDTHDLRAALIARLGRWPEWTPLDAAFGPEEDQGDHTRTLVRYAVEPGERVTAWLLRPHGEQPEAGWPAVLALHQHNGEYHLGKAEPAGLAGSEMYHYGVELTRRGFVTLCPDHLCFEDRRPPEASRTRNTMLDGPGYERFEFTRRIAQGSCLQTKYLHDLVAALDLLAELPVVDEQRLGVIGHSLGGQEALWLAWYDPRVRAAVSSCGFGQIRTILRDEINHNLALYIPGMLELCDSEALVADLAPRAFLLTAGTEDWIFPVDGVRAIAETAYAAYAAAGAADRFEAIIFEGGHSFTADLREQAYRFLERQLGNDE